MCIYMYIYMCISICIIYIYIYIYIYPYLDVRGRHNRLVGFLQVEFRRVVVGRDQVGHLPRICRVAPRNLSLRDNSTRNSWIIIATIVRRRCKILMIFSNNSNNTYRVKTSGSPEINSWKGESRTCMLGGWVNPHREQQTIPQGQTSISPKSFSTPTANGQIAPWSGSARGVGRGAGSYTPSTASETDSTRSTHFTLTQRHRWKETDGKVCWHRNPIALTRREYEEEEEDS